MAIKLVVFDFDGTIADYPLFSSWQLIDKELGCEKEDKILEEECYSGRIDFATWARKSVDLYKKYGLDKASFDKIIHNNLKLMTGARETFDELRRKGIAIAIVSGGILNIYHFLSEKYGIKADHIEFEAEIFFDGNGSISGGNFLNVGFEGKIDAIEKICQQLGISMREVAMVGDGYNDIYAFRKVGLPIAFNTNDPQLLKTAKFAVKEKDLRKILPLIA